MSEEQKKALTGLCKIEIKRWKASSESNPNMRYMSELMEIALTALTAQPVKLPKQTSYRSPDGEKFELYYKEDMINAILAAGYEVQE